MKYIIFLFLALMPFTNAFAINSVLTPVFAVSFLLVLNFVFNGKKKISTTPPYLLLFSILYTVSFLVMSTGDKCRNHYFLWIFPFFVYYYVVKNELYACFSLNELKHKVLKVVTYTTLFACVFSIFEFVCSNYLKIDLSFIPRGRVLDYNPFDFGFYRSRSFVEESGQFALFLELLAPISIYWINNNIRKSVRYFLYTIVALGLFTTLSAVGFVSFLIYIYLIADYYLFHSNKRSESKFGFVLIAGLFLLSLLLFFPNVVSFTHDVISLKLDSDNISYVERSERFEALKFLNGPAFFIGYGPAAFSTLNIPTFISFYLGVVMNTGIIGLVLFLLFLASKYKEVNKIKDGGIKLALKSSLILSSIHLMFVDNIYTPWLWLMYSLIDVFYLKELNSIRKQIKVL